MIAYCWASGLIEFGEKCPKNAIPLGEHENIKEIVPAIARLAYDGKTLLVPGIPEAPDNDHQGRLKALEQFQQRLEKIIASR